MSLNVTKEVQTEFDCLVDSITFMVVLNVGVEMQEKEGNTGKYVTVVLDGLKDQYTDIDVSSVQDETDRYVLQRT